MGQPCAKIFIAQIGMGVKMNDRRIRIYFKHLPEGAKRHKVLTAKHHRKLSRLKISLV